MTLRYLPMDPEAFARFREESIEEYARKNARAGRAAPGAALAEARAEFARLLPQGERTPDHFLRTLAEGPEGVPVGVLWYALRREGGAPTLFVYWIGIDAPFRRHGYASEALGQVEAEARRLGAPRVGLHVFGENRAALALYEKLGYSATSVLMAKELAPAAAAPAARATPPGAPPPRAAPP